MQPITALSPSPALLSRILRAAFALLAAAGGLNASAAALPEPASAAVFSEALPGFDPALAADIRAQVQAAGYAAEFIGAAVLTNPAALTAERYDLLVLPGARALPMSASPAIKRYLQEGGDLLALGLPAWQAPIYRIKDQWVSRATYEARVAAQRSQHAVEDFDHLELARWSRSAGEPGGEAQYELAASPRGQALHVKIPHMGGWETLTSPAFRQPFPPGHTLTCFRAKGGPKTRQLSLEWREADGSRWIATVDLTQEWQDYSLLPDRFKAWPVPAASANARVFQPANAVTCAVGLSHSHTALEGLQHEYWFDELGTAPNPFGEDMPPAEPDIPQIESVCPSYQCFPISTPVVVRADRLKVPLEDWEAQQENAAGRDAIVYAGLQPRARGIGFAQGRAYRWEPLLGAYDASNADYRGALAALVVNVEPPFRGSVWAAFTPDAASFYRKPVVTNCLHQVLARMRRGVFLAEGGAEFFTVFADQPFRTGASVVNFGKAPVTNLHVSLNLLDATGRSRRKLLDQSLTLAPGEARTIEQPAVTRGSREEGVSVSLTLDGGLVDGLRHELGEWRPPAQPQFIEARDGGFQLRGQPWKAHGVNYMPSSGIGLVNGQYFESWLGRGAYDPEVIQRDLLRVKAMNLNTVSVFLNHDPHPSQHLLDFLRRCAALGLHVNQSLRPGTPMNFQWRETRESVEYYRLASNDTVFAYDLAWEPSHGNHAQQQHDYAARWNAWVKRYVTPLAAEKPWGLTTSQSELATPHFEVPPMSHLTHDGEWRKLVADYRRFLDNLLHEKYSEARQLMKSIDPHHAVSFRMSCAGDPSYNWDEALPYDFYGLAGAVDLWAPEAYGRIGDWERVRAGAFTAAYARLCDAQKPIMWAEMGYTAWDMNRMAPDPEKLAYEARYYADFYRMLIMSGADGVCFWWYPGGFRLGENSDFGIINPDGTDRPVTKVIRAEGPRFLTAPKPGAPDYWIAVNRDRDSRGLYGIYEAVQAEYWQAVSAGHRPALKWQTPPGQR